MRKSRTLEDRTGEFWSRVKVVGDCWEWQGTICSNGYGSTHLFKHWTRWAHRVSYLLSKGDIPPGKEILHSCDNRRCINPEHLSVGTRKQNMLEASKRGKLTHWDRPRGELNASSVYTEALIREAYLRVKSGQPQERVISELGITKVTLKRVIKGKSWKHLNIEPLPDLRRKNV